MKFAKKKGYEGTVRSVWNDEKTHRLGIVGTIKDLMEIKILSWCDYDKDLYCFISDSYGNDAFFGKTREEAINNYFKE